MVLYLASKSERRQQLLSQINITFETINTDIDETKRSNENVLSYVTRMAEQKAAAGWKHPLRLLNKPVLAADTCVCYQQKLLDKPRDEQDAKEILSFLGGKTHQVMTSLVIMDQNSSKSAISITDVSFAALSQSLIDYYVATGECFDKAGSYAIQGYAARFIAAINGSYSGVVGLPLFETSNLIEEFIQAKKK